MQNLDHWGEVQTLHVFLSNFALSHMAFPLDTTSVHSLTTAAVRPMYIGLLFLNVIFALKMVYCRVHLNIRTSSHIK